jgi:hypothetical protein
VILFAPLRVPQGVTWESSLFLPFPRENPICCCCCQEKPTRAHTPLQYYSSHLRRKDNKERERVSFSSRCQFGQHDPTFLNSPSKRLISKTASTTERHRFRYIIRIHFHTTLLASPHNPPSLKEIGTVKTTTTHPHSHPLVLLQEDAF